MKHLPCILQVSTADMAGGAEGSALRLFREYRRRGFPSYLAVGRKTSDDPDILLIPNDAQRNLWAHFWAKASGVLSTAYDRNRAAKRLRGWLYWAGQPKRILETRRGYEDFNYPGVWKILELASQQPNIVHCHNLHGNYFDLRALPSLSHRVPVILNLRDAWLLSGHCAHSFDCEKWKTGCGECPDLSIPPSIRSDSTTYNWQRKQKIFSDSRVYVTTPSKWLFDKVEQSILAQAVAIKRIIPNGVDLSLFCPADRIQVRRALGLPKDAMIVLFAANGIQSNIWKDYKMLRHAIKIAAEKLKQKQVIFLALGESASQECEDNVLIRFIPHEKDRVIVAQYFQAADLYVHAARADTFPNTVLEAMACGTPVVATAVGGIPEQVKDGNTGFLVPSGNSKAMADAIEVLLNNESLRFTMGQMAKEDVKQRFGLDQQVDNFLNWYNEVIEDWKMTFKGR